jgi:hypothetical protein
MEELLSRLRDLLLALPYAKTNTARTHVMIRCPICGDSVKHHDSTHCYVNIELGKPISYYCFSNCSEGHWVDSNFLNALGITDLVLLNGVKKYNRSFLNNEEKHDYQYVIHKYESKVIKYNSGTKYESKLDYINKRLGSNLDFDDCKELKIILSLYDFLNVNDFYPNMKNFMINILDSDYVGFLSADNSYIIFRDITGKNKIRYINYPVFKNSGAWGSKLYIIPGEYDLMANNISCNITEGVFDILSCYININNKNKNNNLYAAVNGSGFLGVIKKILHVGFINNINLNIYADNDKPKEFFKSLEQVNDFCKSINLFYNRYQNEKDIGVPKEKIKIYKTKMVF